MTTLPVVSNGRRLAFVTMFAGLCLMVGLVALSGTHSTEATTSQCANNRWQTYWKPPTSPVWTPAYTSEAQCESAFTTPDCPLPAVMLSPLPGTVLSGSTVTFTWSTGCGNNKWDLWLGSTFDGAQYYDAADGSFQSVMVSGLPTNGSPIYFRLTSSNGTETQAWLERCTFVAAGGTPASCTTSPQPPTPASTPSPTPSPAPPPGVGGLVSVVVDPSGSGADGSTVFELALAGSILLVASAFIGTRVAMRQRRRDD